MTNHVSRRSFIVTSGLTAAGLSMGMKNSFWSSGQQVRVGIIGTGSRGTGLASEISKISKYQLIACCDIRQKNLDRAMKYAAPGAKAYGDYRALLDDPNVDAVVISTPLYLHSEMVIDAVDAGKHIYCEKTMCYDTPQTLEVTRKVKSSDLVFQCGFQYRYDPMFDTVYQGIQNGDIGEIKHFICHYNRNNNWRRPVDDPALERLINWRMYREYSGGLAAELSSHQIDVVNRMLGSRPERISGYGSINRYKDGRETYDNINLTVAYPNKVAGIVSSHLSNQHQNFVIKLIGTLGTVEMHYSKAFYIAEADLVEQSKNKGIVDGVSGATMKIEPGKAWEIPVERNDGWGSTTYAVHGFADSIIDGAPVKSTVETAKESSLAVHMSNNAMRNQTIEVWQQEYNI